MTRAFLPNPSAQAEWLLAGIIEPCIIGDMLPLDGGPGDHDHADSADDDDIASLASCSFESVQPSSLKLLGSPSLLLLSSPPSLPIKGGLFLAGDGFSG